MYKALDVAKYIIYSERKNSRLVNNIRLQKLLYFVQAYFYQETGHACFDDAIEAWEIGPVVPIVFQEYRINGTGTIFSYLLYDEQKESLPKKDKQLIDKALEICKTHSTVELTNISRRQDPWKKAYAKRFCYLKSTKIKGEDMKEYFWEDHSKPNG